MLVWLCHKCTRDFQSIEVGGQIIGSRNGCRESLSHIFAKWTGQVGKIMMDGEERPWQIQYFVHHRICWGGSWHDSLLAAVLWNYSHDMKNKFDGVTLWCAEHYQNEGPSFYLPVQRIVSLCLSCIRRITCYVSVPSFSEAVSVDSVSQQMYMLSAYVVVFITSMNNM